MFSLCYGLIAASLRLTRDQIPQGSLKNIVLVRDSPYVIARNYNYTIAKQGKLHASLSQILANGL